KPCVTASSSAASAARASPARLRICACLNVTSVLVAGGLATLRSPVWMNRTELNSLKIGVRFHFQRIDRPAAPLITLYREYGGQPQVRRRMGAVTFTCDRATPTRAAAPPRTPG